MKENKLLVTRKMNKFGFDLQIYSIYSQMCYDKP